jgi:hypothetical protein
MLNGRAIPMNANCDLLICMLEETLAIIAVASWFRGIARLHIEIKAI